MELLSCRFLASKEDVVRQQVRVTSINGMFLKASPQNICHFSSARDQYSSAHDHYPSHDQYSSAHNQYSSAHDHHSSTHEHHPWAHDHNADAAVTVTVAWPQLGSALHEPTAVPHMSSMPLQCHRVGRR